MNRRVSMAVIGMCRERLRRRLGARVGAGMGLAVAVVCGGVALGMKDANEAALAELATAGVRWLAWLSVGPLLLSAAASPAARDREDGILALARVHGVQERGLGVARVLAAVTEASLRLGLWSVGLCLLMAALSMSVTLLSLAGGVLLFSLLAGIVLGGLAATCGELGQARGRSLVLAVVFLPWMAAEVGAAPAIALPQLLDAGLRLLSGPWGVG